MSAEILVIILNIKNEFVFKIITNEVVSHEKRAFHRILVSHWLFLFIFYLKIYLINTIVCLRITLCNFNNPIAYNLMILHII